MAFVSKSPRRVFEQQAQPHEKLCGAVELGKPLGETDKTKRSPAPFNSSCKRNKQQKHIKPGPGSYNVGGTLLKEVVLEESQEMGVKVVEPAKPTSQFKSGTIRFMENFTVSPGPGAYQESVVSRPQSRGSVRRPSPIIEFLKAQQRPKQGNILGLNVNLRDLELTLQTSATGKEKEVKPSTFFRSTVERNFMERPRTTLGPGSYNLLEDFVKPKTPESKQRPVKTASLARCEKFRAEDSSQVQRSTENKHEKFDVNVGPGYYYNAKLHSSFRAKSANQCMGSKVERFCEPKQSILGPGSYLIKNNNSSSEAALQSSFFRSSQKRFSDARRDCKGPGLYNLNNTLGDRINMLKKRGPSNVICGKSSRFVHCKQADTPGPGSYEFDKLSTRPASNERPASVQRTHRRTQFWSEPQRTHSSDSATPAPGSYELNRHTISSKVKVRRNDEHSHAAPFMSCEQRFRENVQIQSLQDFVAMEEKPQPATAQTPKRPNSKAPFQSTDERFKLPANSSLPDPTKYNVQGPLVKPSFNIMFCR